MAPKAAKRKQAARRTGATSSAAASSATAAAGATAMTTTAPPSPPLTPPAQGSQPAPHQQHHTHSGHASPEHSAQAPSESVAVPFIHFYESFRPTPALQALISSRIEQVVIAATAPTAATPAASIEDTTSPKTALGTETPKRVKPKTTAKPFAVFPASPADIFATKPLTASQRKALPAKEVEIIQLLRTWHEAKSATPGTQASPFYSPHLRACHALAHLFCQLRRAPDLSAYDAATAPSDEQMADERAVKDAAMGCILDILHLVTGKDEPFFNAEVENIRAAAVLVLLSHLAVQYTEDLRFLDRSYRSTPYRFVTELHSTSFIRTPQLGTCCEALRDVRSAVRGNECIVLHLLQGPIGRIYFHHLRIRVLELRCASGQQYNDGNATIMMRLISELLLPGVHERGFPRAKRGDAPKRFSGGVNLDLGAELGTGHPLLPHLQLMHEEQPESSLGVALLGELVHRSIALPATCRDLASIWVAVAEEMVLAQLADEWSHYEFEAQPVSLLKHGSTTLGLPPVRYVLAAATALLEHTAVLRETGNAGPICTDHPKPAIPRSASSKESETQIRALTSRDVALASARAAVCRLAVLAPLTEDVAHPSYRLLTRAYNAVGYLEGDTTWLCLAVARLERMAALNPTPYLSSPGGTPLLQLACAYLRVSELLLPNSFTLTKAFEYLELPAHVPSDPPDLADLTSLKAAATAVRASRRAIKLFKMMASKNGVESSAQQSYADALLAGYVIMAFLGKGEPSVTPAGWRVEAIRMLMVSYELYDKLCEGALLLLDEFGVASSPLTRPGKTSTSTSASASASLTGEQAERVEQLREHVLSRAEMSVKVYLCRFVKVGSTLVSALEEAIRIPAADQSLASPWARISDMLPVDEEEEEEQEVTPTLKPANASANSSSSAAPPHRYGGEGLGSHFATGAAALKQYKRDLVWVRERHKTLVSAVHRIAKEAKLELKPK